MSKHEHADRHPTSSNLFVDLNGIPYILAEYLDRTCIQQIDHSIIKSGLFIDDHEAMRAVIDVSIDDIGRKNKNHRPAVIGNTTKHRKLIDMINKNAQMLDHQLSVLRSGILVRVSYDVENYRTHQVMRSMTEDLRIANRNFFLTINPDDINDNGIITNFTDTIVSSVNDFTHGRDRMLFRITGIKLFYERVKSNPMKPNTRQSLRTNDLIPEIPFNGHMNEYDYHNAMQHQHFIGDLYDDGREHIEPISPPSWTDFNRFYHFDDGGRDIVLHNQEIYDAYTDKILIPCGKINVNSAFVINPGHRIIFKFSIWKNDVTVVPNTRSIAQALKAPVYGFMGPEFTNDKHGHYHDKNHKEKVDKEQFDLAMKLLAESRHHEKEQDKTIKSLTKAIKELEAKINGLHPSEEPEPEPEVPPVEDDCGCDCECGDYGTMTKEEMQDMFNDIKSEITLEEEDDEDEEYYDDEEESDDDSLSDNSIDIY